MADRAVGTGYTGRPRTAAGFGSGRSDIGVELLDELTDFTYALRVAGLPVTIEATMEFFRAASALDPAQRVGLYAVGRATFCACDDDFDCYDMVFERFFAAVPLPQRRRGAIPGRHRPAASQRNGADA